MTSRQRATNKADKYFSVYIRTRFADNMGNTCCSTCGKVAHWKALQCGHFMTRGRLSTRWDEHNASAQCGRCNMLGGEQFIMAKWLDDHFGEGTAESIHQKSHQKVKLSTQDIEDIANKFKDLCKDWI